MTWRRGSIQSGRVRQPYLSIRRRERLPKVDVYGWSLQETLPPISVPLADEDPDATLNLAAAFTTTYDRAGYDYSLNYKRPLRPALEPARDDWLRAIVKSGRAATH